MKIHSKVTEALCLVKNKTYPFSRSLIDLAGYKLRDPTGKFQRRSPSLGFWINCYKPFLRFYQSVNWTDKESSMLFFIEPCLRDGPGLLLGVISAQVLLLKTRLDPPSPPHPIPSLSSAPSWMHFWVLSICLQILSQFCPFSPSLPSSTHWIRSRRFCSFSFYF